ncbi:single-stranded DNA-binding protein [Microbacterium jejuense]|uniref:single-stranded DNA-binding protein n=1 Tax=Microbacterium jejuense TaxID=1263637 RepID=UPI0031E52BDD
MSDQYDSITVTGNVASDPQFRRTQNGLPITSFRVASGQRKFDRQTERWVDSGTNWYTVSVFRGLADHAFASLHRGDRVILTGRLRQREWESGEKSGIAFDIEADALGHDLLWGTTTFVKDDRRRAVDPVPADAWQTPAGGDAWATPGLGGDGRAAVLAEPPVPELVGAAAGGADDAGSADAPF